MADDATARPRPSRRADPSVRGRTSGSVDLARKYQETGTLPYQRPISRARRRPYVRQRRRTAALEWRERVAPLDRPATRCRARETTMKDQIKARLFGLAATVAMLAMFAVPEWGKRW